MKESRTKEIEECILVLLNRNTHFGVREMALCVHEKVRHVGIGLTCNTNTGEVETGSLAGQPGKPNQYL